MLNNSVTDRFLRYISYDTQSKEDEEQVPSTKKQMEFGRLLAAELKEMGVSDVRMDEHGYIYGEIPANTQEKTRSLGFIAHMDTSPALSGKDVKPQFVKDYDGGDICLNKEKDIWLLTSDFPEMKNYKGKTLITTDGTTLLGADDKAGVAEIMTMAAWFLSHPEEKHGKICIAFTPDEEVGRGADFFDVEGFGAEAAYTVDGGALGEMEYENFNAASGHVMIQGKGIHPGSAKGKMKNALLVAMEFQSLLPAFENPMYTEGYEGFYHLDHMEGDVEGAQMDFIIPGTVQAAFSCRKHQHIESKQAQDQTDNNVEHGRKSCIFFIRIRDNNIIILHLPVGKCLDHLSLFCICTSCILFYKGHIVQRLGIALVNL